MEIYGSINMPFMVERRYTKDEGSKNLTNSNHYIHNSV